MQSVLVNLIHALVGNHSASSVARLLWTGRHCPGKDGIISLCYLTILHVVADGDLLLCRGGGQIKGLLSADSGRRASARLRSISWLTGVTDADLPVPGIVIEHLDLITALECTESIHSLLVTCVPLAWSKVDKSTLVLAELDHINALDETPSQIDEDLLDTAPADVVKDPRDTQANTRCWVSIGTCVARGLLRGRVHLTRVSGHV